METSITLSIQHNVHTEKNGIQCQGVNGRVRRFQVTGKTSTIATTTRKLRNKNRRGKCQSSESAKHRNQIKTKKKITKQPSVLRMHLIYYINLFLSSSLILFLSLPL